MRRRHRHRRRHHRRAQPGRRSPTAGAVGRVATASSPSTSRSPGWVEHDAGRDLGRRRRPRCSTCSAQLGRAGRRHRHHQPARDGRGLGPPHRRSRCTGRSCGRTGAPPAAATSCATAGHLALVRGAHRPRARPVLLGHEDRVAAAPRAACAAGDRPGARHHRRLAALEPHRRRGPRHRPVQRQPHDAVRHRRAGAGATSCATCSACPLDALPEVRPSSGRFGVTVGPLRRPGRHPRLRHRRRPAGRAVRPGLLRAGHDQEHLRHRQLRADERRPGLPARRSRACSRRSPGRWPTAPSTYALEGAIFVTGAAVQWLRDGLGHHRPRPTRSGPLAASVPDTGGVVRRARLHRPGQPVVGPVRPGHDRRHHPGHDPRPPRPGRGRGDGLPDPRRGRGHGRGRRARRCTTLRVDGGAAAMDLLLQLQADQLGVTVRRPGRPGDDRARRRLPGRAGRGRLGLARRDRRGLAARRRVPAGRRPHPGRRRLRDWLRAVERSRAWADA